MKQILVQLDDHTASLLEAVVPGRTRKRSKFIRDAVMRALLEVVDVRTRRAYERHATAEPWHFDPEAWAPASEAIHPEKPLGAPRRRRAKT